MVHDFSLAQFQSISRYTKAAADKLSQLQYFVKNRFKIWVGD